MKMFQITESDLEVLESSLPELIDGLGVRGNARIIQEHVALVKKILSDVRWNYGPHSEIEEHDL